MTMQLFLPLLALSLHHSSADEHHVALRTRHAKDFNSIRFKVLEDKGASMLNMLRQQQADLQDEADAMIELVDAMEMNSEGLSMDDTDAPTPAPTPVVPPIMVPEEPSSEPTMFPVHESNSTADPSLMPSDAPTFFPTLAPTDVPTFSGSSAPSQSPSAAPILSPSNAPTTTFAPSGSPTLDACGITSQQRRDQILNILRQVADPVLIEDFETPQGMATDWIINNDLRRLCPDSLKIIQRWALAVMYFSTGGDEWEKCASDDLDCGGSSPFFNRQAFLSPSIECQWAGISCNAEACVTEIEFEENNLVGTIPTELGLLSDLVIWGMERGNLTGTIPSEMGSLQNLVFIDLDYNSLTGTLPQELFGLTNLTQLDLNNNALEGSVDGIENFEKLEFLQLHSNLFTGTIPDGVENFSGLRTFTLHQTMFVGSIPEGLCTMAEAETLMSLIADCTGPEIFCDCCTDCRP